MPGKNCGAYSWLTGFLIFLVRLSSEPAPASFGTAEALLSVRTVALILVVEGDLVPFPDVTAREKTNPKLSIHRPLKIPFSVDEIWQAI